MKTTPSDLDNLRAAGLTHPWGTWSPDREAWGIVAHARIQGWLTPSDQRRLGRCLTMAAGRVLLSEVTR